MILFCLISEYIVSFNGYYKRETRKRYVQAALHDSDTSLWSIIDRDNPAFDYPSDFDLVKVSNDLQINLQVTDF